MKKIMNLPNIGTQRIKNTVYVFEDAPYWDTEKRQNRHRRNYIGKLNSDGEFIPNKSYAARLLLEKKTKKHNDVLMAQRKYWGASYLLGAIGERTGLVDDLKVCFPGEYKKILSLAWYLVMESESSMYRFKKWELAHLHPLGTELPDQRISELFASISENAKMQFFALQSKRRLEREYLAYDTTSISSYSELIHQVRYGYNKDGEPLPQINLALVFGENSMLPVYYRKLPGNIPDVKTVCKLLKDVAFLDISKAKLVMDRGFYSTDNVNSLYRNHYKFLLSPRANSGFVKSFLEAERENVRDYKNYSMAHDAYCLSRTAKWPYGQEETSNASSGETRRIYVHLYYNGQRAEAEKAAFVRQLAEAEQALREGNATEEQMRLGRRYFAMTGTPGRGMRIEHDEKGIREHVRNCGYFFLLSNEVKNPEVALEIYRNKDLVEKAFCNLKNRLDMKKTAVSSSESLEGKLFVQFIALIYVSYIHKYMRERGLYRNYTMQTLLDELDVIERYQYSASKVHYSEMTKKQLEIFAAFNLPLPNTL